MPWVSCVAPSPPSSPTPKQGPCPLEPWPPEGATAPSSQHRGGKTRVTLGSPAQVPAPCAGACGQEKAPSSSKQQSAPQHAAPLGEGSSPSHCSPGCLRFPGPPAAPSTHLCVPPALALPALAAGSSTQTSCSGAGSSTLGMRQIEWSQGGGSCSTHSKGTAPKGSPRGAPGAMLRVPGGRMPGGTQLRQARGWLPDAFTPPVPDSGARHVGFPGA